MNRQVGRWWCGLFIAIAFVLGIAGGTGLTRALLEPEIVVETETVTEEVEVVKEVVPDACLDSIVTGYELALEALYVGMGSDDGTYDRIYDLYEKQTDACVDAG